MNKNIILEVKNLTKKFKQFTAVDDISFSINADEIVGLLGPNGAGKTTTIQMLLGVLNPTYGEISYFGQNFANNREQILEKVNFSSTYTNLPLRLTVRECLTFIAYLYDIKNRANRLKNVIKAFKLDEIERKSISQLSAGQKTRVNLAKAFINNPKILLLDEPTASMDPEIANYLRELIMQKKKEYGLSIIWTSHNMPEVEEMCSRVIFINKGKIIADDTPEKLSASIEICQVDLLIQDGLKRIIAYNQENQLNYYINNKRVITDIKEKNLAQFLRDIGNIKIIYQEISIQKPTLEDYFLQVTNKKHEDT